MDETTTQPESATEKPVERELFARIGSAMREEASEGRALRAGFRELCAWLAAPFGEMSVRLAAEVVEDYWHQGAGDPRFWREPLRALADDACTERRAMARLYQGTEGNATVALVAVPCGGAGHLAAAVNLSRADAVHECVRTISAATAFIDSAASLVQARNTAASGSGAGSAQLMESISKSSGASSRHELAYAITNSLRSRLSCEQVILGAVSGPRVRVLSVSGFDDLRERNPGVRIIRAALEECVDRGQQIVCQRADKWDETLPTDGHRLHRAWHADASGAAVATVPLRVGDSIEFVLGLRGGTDQTFSNDQLDAIAQNVAPYAPALTLVERATRGLPAHVTASLRAGIGWAIRPGAIVKKMVLLSLVVLTLWIAFGSMNYSVTIPCSVSPARLQHVSAPFDGKISETYVRAGDEVEAGQALFALDVRDLELRRDELLAQIEVSRIESARAIAVRDQAEADHADATRRGLEAQLASVERRIRSATARASAAGTVIEGDLRMRTGQVVTFGEPLYVIAPHDSWLLELEVPEGDVDELDPALSGRFSADARPEERCEFTLARILPHAQERRGSNVFVAEADLLGDQAWLRPGMEGVARVEIGRRPVWWVLAHGSIESIRRKFWL